MKNSRIFLHGWRAGSEHHWDIPWPDVHKTTGTACINWLHSQRPEAVQLILEHDHTGQHSLWAEFYSEAVNAVYDEIFAAAQHPGQDS